MNSDALKLLAPIAFMAMWMKFAIGDKSLGLAMAALFFTSIAAFSQNFTFIYRETHQVIQLVMIGLLIFNIVRSPRIYGFNRILFAFLGFIGVSLVFSGLDADSSAQLINFVVILGIVNSLYLAIKNESRLNKIFEYIAQLSVAVAIFGLMEFAFGFSIGQRIEGTFANSNYFAFFLGVGYCAAFERFHGVRRIFCLLVILTALVLSGARAALAFPVLEFFWRIYRSGNIFRILSYGAVGATVMAIVILSGATRFSATEGGEESDAERFIFATVAFRMASDHPLTGVGWGRYITEFGSYSSTTEQVLTDNATVDVSEQDRRVTHNDLIRIAAELGWLAAASAIIILISGFRILLKEKHRMDACIFPMWAGAFLFSLTHNNLNSAFFWFIFILPFHFRSRVEVGK